MDCKIALLLLAALVYAVESRSIKVGNDAISRDKRSPDDSFGDTFKGAFDSAKEKLDGAVKDFKDSDAYKKTSSTLGDAVKDIKDSDAYKKTSSTFGDLKDKVKDIGSNLKEKFLDD
uniref:Uncharacterized protein n=1 Tax=Clastoptera arizonana TaxID=38151 RepID=A0A1B6DBZ3_9HEMI